LNHFFLAKKHPESARRSPRKLIARHPHPLGQMLGETVCRDGVKKLWVFKHQNGDVYRILTSKNCGNMVKHVVVFFRGLDMVIIGL